MAVAHGWKPWAGGVQILIVLSIEFALTVNCISLVPVHIDGYFARNLFWLPDERIYVENGFRLLVNSLRYWFVCVMMDYINQFFGCRTLLFASARLVAIALRCKPRQEYLFTPVLWLQFPEEPAPQFQMIACAQPDRGSPPTPKLRLADVEI